MYVVVFFLLLWTLFQLILCEARCVVDNNDDTFIYILQTDDVIHIEKNYQFSRKFMNTSFKRLIKDPVLDQSFESIPDTLFVLKHCSKDLIEIMEDTKQLRHVIDLHVGDIKNYKNIDTELFVWAGDIEDSVCAIDINTSNQNMTETGGYEREPCNIRTEPRKHVKMVSKAVETIPSLFEFVRDFDFHRQKLLRHVILVCTEAKSDLTNLNIEIDLEDVFKTIRYTDCTEKHTIIPPHVIAILAPNPDWIEETNKPIIFYDEPYVTPAAKEYYENSIMRRLTWKPMTDTFLSFMIQNKWRRVAILSDDAVESADFQIELQLLFHSNDISYIVRSVGEVNKIACCNFTEALISLKQAEARIIIANVAQQHAQTLAQQAKSSEMTFLQNIVWLARDWSKDEAKQAGKNMYAVFSFIPERTPYEKHLEAIQRVIDLNRFDDKYDFSNEVQFARDIKKQLTWSNESIFTITRSDPIDHRIFAKRKGEQWSFYEPRLKLPKDRRGQCLIKSNNYTKFCDDLNVIFGLLVIVSFVVTLLGITYFFQSPPCYRLPN